LAISCVHYSDAGTPKEFVFVPDPDADDAALLSGAIWVATGSDFTLNLQRIDERERRAYIEKVTGSATDPFAAPPGHAPGFVTFVMQLENNGGGILVFRAQQCWLVTDRNEILHPIGMDGLRARYGMVGRELGPAYEQSLAAVIPTSRMLNPGETMAGLLVYSRFKPNTKRYRLDIQITTANGDVALVTAPYRRIKKERSNSP
jgi:hypothetical protein